MTKSAKCSKIFKPFNSWVLQPQKEVRSQVNIPSSRCLQHASGWDKTRPVSAAYLQTPQAHPPGSQRLTVRLVHWHIPFPLEECFISRFFFQQRNLRWHITTKKHVNTVTDALIYFICFLNAVLLIKWLLTAKLLLKNDNNHFSSIASLQIILESPL